MGQLWPSSAAADENEKETFVEQLNVKFAVEDDITLYTNALSPCARRVKMTLIEKDVPFREVEVDITKGEQGCQAYRKLNPNMKVPALTVRNVEGIQDVCLYESNVITEFLDAVFPGTKLYPRDKWELAQCREWQDWELALTDDFVPVAYSNSLMLALMKLTYSTEETLINSLKARNVSKSTISKMVKGYRGATCPSREDMIQHSIGILKSFMHLENALEGKEYLVGNRFTVADLSVFPRVAMANVLKIAVNDSTFPNISRYMRNLSSRKCFYDTSPPYYMALVDYCSSWVTSLAGWITGKRMEQVDLTAYHERAKDEYRQMKFPVAHPLPVGVIHPDAIVLFHYNTAAPCWQAQLLLKLKEKEFRVVDCDVVETIGRPSGTGGIFRIQHGDKMVTGSRGMLEYLDMITGEENALYPSDPKEKAECLCWQAWEQTTFVNDVSQLYEMEVVSAAMHVRFPRSKIDSLLSLRSDVNFSDKFNAIMRSYLSRVKKSHPRFADLMENYSHLKPSIRDRNKLTVSTMERLHERLAYLNEQLEDKKFLAGKKITIADCSVFVLIVLLSFIGLKVSDRKFPNVARWIFSLRKVDEFRDIEDDMRHELQRYIDRCEQSSDSDEDFDLI